ncbi:hypothetical protein CCM_06793 [Cordyceps militaris CM01]|uniref:Uncharacterized protein n=1 Tax=Cordyceps militaris (strain CM01) TaxID=983644 RepID=G3JKZ9_CORMM|nr:uncharacterized protein CCM_06793 [Cordyceps militaris CM01]EGX90373.1 hypothetical protein CCM_06793 [Cordyceps militaris CM01]
MPWNYFVQDCPFAYYNTDPGSCVLRLSAIPLYNSIKPAISRHNLCWFSHLAIMCRMVVFAGTCTKCGEANTWEELSQALSCLEAKNNGGMGDCANGVNIEQHKFDQECDRCSQEDEGLGGVGLYESPQRFLKEAANMNPTHPNNDSPHSPHNDPQNIHTRNPHRSEPEAR